MDAIKALEKLLPGFQDFLFELQKCDLTNALQETLNSYLNRLDSYISENANEIGLKHEKQNLPELPPPPLPIAAVEIDTSSNESIDEIAAQRNLSWLNSNTSSSFSHIDNTEADGELYEQPMSEKKASQCKQVLPECDPGLYEEPNQNSTPGREIEDLPLYEPVDEKVCGERFIDDNELLYEDASDNVDEQPVTNGTWSDASGSYEEYDDDEIDQKLAPTLPERDIIVRKKEKKSAKFKLRCENDPYIVHYGILSKRVFGGTLSRTSLEKLKWKKVYCILHRGLLSIYNNPTDKTPAKSITLFGYNIIEEESDGKDEYVFGIHHQGQTTQSFYTKSKEKFDTWVKVLTDEATNVDNIPSGREPYSPSTEVTEMSFKDKIKIPSIPNMMKRRSKAAPMLLTEDSEGNLGGVVNISSPYHKIKGWKAYYFVIQNQFLHVYKDLSNEKLIFSQPLEGLEIGQGKVPKRKNTLTLFQGEEIYVYIEAVNLVDNGKLLSKLIKETGFAASMEGDYIIPNGQMEIPEQKNSRQQSSIFSLLQRFETATELEDSARSEEQSSIYLDMNEPESPSTTLEVPAIYENQSEIEIRKDKGMWLKSILQPKKSPNPIRKVDKDKVKEEKKDKKKNKKKNKEKKETETKDDDEDDSKDTEISDKVITPKSDETKAKEKTSDAPKIENKFVKSDKKHLLDVDRLQGQRTTLLEKREELRIRKRDLRGRKNACEDETKKAKIEEELNEAIQEWTASSKELTELEEKIQKLSKGDEVLQVNTIGTPASKGNASPMLQRAKSSKNVMERAKMFESLGNN